MSGVPTADSPALTRYFGSYREKVKAVITRVDEDEGDLAWVGHFRLRAAIRRQ